MFKTNTIDFTKGRPSRNIIKMFLPLYISYFCTILYDIIGSLWVGTLLGEKALAAQSASVPAVMLFSAIVMGATNGITILLSRYLGSKNHAKVKSTIITSLISLFLFGLILMAVCLIGINGILTSGNVPKQIFGIAKTYLFFRILSFPFIELYMYFAAVLRSYGNTSMQMITVIISTILNIVLDPILILHIGINGAAIATLMSQIVTMLIMIIYILKMQIISFNLRAFNFESLKEIAWTSVPSAIQQSIPTISMAFIQSLFSSFGVVSLAAYSVASKLEIIVLYPGLTINMSETTAVGTCYGAKMNLKIKEYLKYGIMCSGGLVLILTPLITIFSNNLSGLFGVSSGAAIIVKKYLEIVAIGYLLNCVINSIMGEMNGLQQQTRSMLLMVFYCIVIRLPIAKLLSSSTMGVDGIAVSILISYIVAIIVAIIYQYSVLNKTVLKVSQQMSDIEVEDVN